MTTKGHLGGYDLMVVSKYFNTIEDFMHMELASPKARNNMEKFHFNPIALDEWSRQFFTSLETFHIYSLDDCTFPNEKFYQRIIWYDIDCEDWIWQREEGEIYKNVVLSQETLEKRGKIPMGVTVLSNRSVEKKLKITNKIVIPSSVTFIGNSYFRDCRYLQELTINEKAKNTIAGDCISQCRLLTALTVPTYWQLKGNRVYDDDGKLFRSFGIPDNLRTINGKEVVIKEMNQLDIPTHVRRLGTACFADGKYTKITLPTTIKRLPDYCFYNCQQLKEITIPTTITKLGQSCFSQCSSLSSLNIPTTVVEIGSWCFRGMTSLKSIELPTSVTKFGKCLLSNCSSLTSITLHDNYNEVKQEDFINCKSLSTITLPSTVTKIGLKAFANDRKLTFNIPSSVTEFGRLCFGNSGISSWSFKYWNLPSHCFE